MRRVVIAAAPAVLAAGITIALATSAAGSTRATLSRAHPAITSSYSRLATDVLTARLATAKYVTNLARARADGYQIITRMIPNMGYHFMNPKVSGFDLRKPAILVFEHHGSTWQLGALEWVFTSMPKTPPLPGAQYGVFGAACHYVDGTLVFAGAQSACAPHSPQTGAAFNFWHPRLITLHFWIWYPNPAGIYMGTNPLAAPLNHG